MIRSAMRSLSWLLPCLAVAAVPALLRAQADRRSDDTANGTAVRNTSVSAEGITTLLADLDACFARGDVAAYLAAFEPDHPGSHAMLRQHLQRLTAVLPRLQRRSALAAPLRQIGARTVVRVRHTIEAGERTLHEDTMMAVRLGADGRAVPTFAIEIPTQRACVRGDFFRCPPCNYEIGGVAGWLCVPMRPERAQSLEAASFYLIGSDVACDVSVVVDTDAPTATTVVRGLGEALAELDTGARPGPVEAWLPPAHAKEPPTGLAAARLEIALPLDFGGRGGIARFHVVTFGALQHLLLVRGSAAAVREHDEALRALLASYRLLQSDLDLALAAAKPLQHHTGGTVHDSRYHNERFGFELAGPDGWQTQQRCGGAALRVVWSSPDGSRLWLTGYEVPAGLDRWCERTADRWLQQLLLRANLEPLPTTTPDGWTEHTSCGGSTRRLTCVPKPSQVPAQSHRAPTGPGAPRERSLHVFLQDELLLVADLQAATAADAATMQAALESLRRQ